MASNLNKYETILRDNQYLGGAIPCADDKAAVEALKGVVIDPNFYPFTFGWFSLVSKFSPKITESWTGSMVSQEVAAPVAAADDKKADDDDDMDLFGSDNEEDAKAAAAEAKAKAAAAKKPKKVVIEKSIVIFDVKPWGEETDLDAMAKAILAIEKDGLFWKTEYKKEPVAFGIYMIKIGCTVEDAKVSIDDLQEEIEALEDYVQSVEIAAFNKV
mmetsp:Transcript_59942/g.82337  ORF Transcript_59942/g.82337 Transcript_59942/m.82337 type:complete len:215 (-) Transcript_59942:123-767(-)|eukprot:CAMPEP_0176364030 /NCGR_PEP_ID=MMETSP0126-20121128/19517_1 /TAXON_ID=141414 ORGANISM="Strombidinopsis acuminatum, Strain SPMC142" /NCGR_SAMPLE_ID=MMETSP0126 /ASSEMBLY_ACC=CAM_ASM_000229 /LENGTH=214 /DNA_ID=CAMNT_0017720533 /DNA_START=39 /DNA_END=683 /DNA_ORIENTATION=-